jgi:hypothetical protein
MSAFVAATATIVSISSASSQVLSTQDIVDLKRVQAAILNTAPVSPLPEIDALQEVVARPDFAAEVANLLKRRASLGPFDPPNWRAINPEVCRAINLGDERCLSLTCLVPSINPKTSERCPASTERAGARRPPDDPSKLGEWLETIGKSLDVRTHPVAAQLQKRELPVDPDIITAKGILHALWPHLLDATVDLQDINAGHVDAILRDVFTSATQRAARAAHIVSINRILASLEPGAKRLIEPSITRLGPIATNLERQFSNAGQFPPSSVDKDIAAGAQILELLAADLAKKLVGTRTAFSTSRSQGDANPDPCQQNGDSILFPIASAPRAGRTLGLALRETSRTDNGLISAELVSTFTADAEIGVQVKLPDQDPRLPSQLVVAAGCALKVIPLGISINNLRERNGKLVHTASARTLTQSAVPEHFDTGLKDLLREAGEVRALPGTAVISRPRLVFSPDFKEVQLLTDLSIPILGVTLDLTVSLVQRGNLVLQPSVAGILNVGELPSRVAAALTMRTVSVGPLSGQIVRVKPAPAAVAAGGTWLAVDAELRLGNRISLGIVETHLVERHGSPRLEVSGDLTSLARIALNSIKPDRSGIVSAIEGLLPSPRTEITDAIAGALLIERVWIADDGKDVRVRLGLDLAALIGPGDLPKVMEEDVLGLTEPDFGLGRIYTKLIKKAFSDTAVAATALARLTEKYKLTAQQMAEKLAIDAVRTLSAAAQPLGVTLSYRPSSKPGEGTLSVAWQRESIDIGGVTIIPGPPARIDFSAARFTEPDGRKLAAMLQSKAIDELKKAIGLAWTPCSQPRFSRAGAGLVLELSAQAPLVGCLPLPAIVFTGSTVNLDPKKLEQAVAPILLENVKRIVPEKYREYVTGMHWDGGQPPIVRFEVKARVPGTSAEVTGRVLVNASTGSFEIKTDVRQALFDEALKSLTGLLGTNFTVHAVPGKLALRASGDVDLGAVVVGVRNMELAPDRVHLPEILVKLPIAITVGPFTVFPVGVQARLAKPVRVALIGDASIAGLQNVLRIRSTMGFEVPPSAIDIRGVMTAVEAFDLFEMNGKIDFKGKRATAESKTVGVLAAVMPTRQTMDIDEKRAQFKSSMQLLAVKVQGGGELRFKSNPDLEISGSAQLAGLSRLAARIAADLELRSPSASISGSHPLPPIGDIKFGAEASTHSVVLNASIIGISVSLILPSLRDLNGGLLKKLFEALLKPSIDLENLNLKDIKITLTPQIGGGSGVGSKGKGKEQGKESGQGSGPDQKAEAPKSKKPPVIDPPHAIRTGTIPSEWQSGWLRSSDVEMYCKAEWKSGREIRWLSSTRAPHRITRLLDDPTRAKVTLGDTDADVTYWKNCNERLENRRRTKAVAFFDGSGVPKIWHRGTSHVEDAGWINDVLKLTNAPGSSSITHDNLPPPSAMAMMLLYRAGLMGSPTATLKQITLSNGKVMYRVTAPDGQSAVGLIHAEGDLWDYKTFPAQSVLAKWIRRVTDDPASPNAALRDRLLPLLFTGNPRALSDVDDRLLLGVDRAQNTLIASFQLREPRCGAQVVSHKIDEYQTDNAVADTFARALLGQQPSCGPSPRWTDVLAVVEGDDLRRIVAFKTGASGDWSLDFVDKERPCLRTGLNGTELSTLIKKWQQDEVLKPEAAAALLGISNGLQPAREAIQETEIAWRERGFPLNPFLKAACETRP